MAKGPLNGSKAERPWVFSGKAEEFSAVHPVTGEPVVLVVEEVQRLGGVE